MSRGQFFIPVVHLIHRQPRRRRSVPQQHLQRPGAGRRRRVVGRRQQVLRRRRKRRQEGPRRQPERPTVLVQRRVDRRFGADATLPETRRRRRRLATGNGKW